MFHYPSTRAIKAITDEFFSDHMVFEKRNAAKIYYPNLATF